MRGKQGPGGVRGWSCRRTGWKGERRVRSGQSTRDLPGSCRSKGIGNPKGSPSSKLSDRARGGPRSCVKPIERERDHRLVVGIVENFMPVARPDLERLVLAARL